MKEKIVLIINTLNQIEVRGSDNMNKLLGSIQALSGILKELSAEPKESKEKENG